MNDALRDRLAVATTPCPEQDADGTHVEGCVWCVTMGGPPGHIYVFGPETRIPCPGCRDCLDGVKNPCFEEYNSWEMAAIRAGANIIRTWLDMSNKCWWAEVRMVAAHLPGSIASASDPTEARLKALELAVQEISGVEL